MGWAGWAAICKTGREEQVAGSTEHSCLVLWGEERGKENFLEEMTFQLEAEGRH